MLEKKVYDWSLKITIYEQLGFLQLLEKSHLQKNAILIFEDMSVKFTAFKL